jgi:TonB family protein
VKTAILASRLYLPRHNPKTRASCCIAVLTILLITTPQLPAPIVETPEQPTPASESEQPAKPKKKRSKPKAFEAEGATKVESRPIATPASTLQGPARFAGTWSGKISQGVLGHPPTTLTVDPAATSVELGRNLGGGTRPVTLSGNTISWHSGMVGEIAWTLTPNGDGQTAQVTMKGLLVNDTATFRRGSAPAAAVASSATTPEKTTAISRPRAGATGSDNSVAIMGKSGPGSMTGPRPDYSAEARKLHLTGRGTFVLHFDPSTGNVTDVTVSQSTGSTILDQSAITTFRQWHATPNGPKEVPMTISFGQTGAQY